MIPAPAFLANPERFMAFSRWAAPLFGALAAAHQGMMPDMGGQAAPATTPERLARMEQMMARHESAMRAMMDATRRFYAQLDPGQKRAFDALPSMLGGRMMMAGPMRGSGDHMSERMEDGPPGPPPR